jgi:hypothetical protein
MACSAAVALGSADVVVSGPPLPSQEGTFSFAAGWTDNGFQTRVEVIPLEDSGSKAVMEISLPLSLGTLLLRKPEQAADRIIDMLEAFFPDGVRRA